jgi:hypothetical protein
MSDFSDNWKNIRVSGAIFAFLGTRLPNHRPRTSFSKDDRPPAEENTTEPENGVF